MGSIPGQETKIQRAAWHGAAWPKKQTKICKQGGEVERKAGECGGLEAK